jgi:hypothetical protein
LVRIIAMRERDERLVVVGQHVDDRIAKLGVLGARRGDVVAKGTDLVHRKLGQLERAPRIRDGEPGPPAKVHELRWAVARHVATREKCERIVARESRRGGHALVEQRVREVLAAARPADHHALELGVHHHVRHADTARQVFRELGARQVHTAGERLRDRGIGLRERSCAQADVLVPDCVRGLDAWSGELEQPARIRGRHEVPRGSQDVRAQDLAAIDRAIHELGGRRFRALPDRPAGIRIVLRLHRDEVLDDRGRRRERCDQPLREQACPSDIQRHRLVFFFFAGFLVTAARYARPRGEIS